MTDYNDNSPDKWIPPNISHGNDVLNKGDLLPPSAQQGRRPSRSRMSTPAWEEKPYKPPPDKNSDTGMCIVWIVVIFLALLIAFALGMLAEAKIIHAFGKCKDEPTLVPQNEASGAKRKTLEPAPYCPHTVSMIGSSGQKYSRKDSLQITTTDTEGCRDLCEKIQTCLHATYEPPIGGAGGICYMELTDQMECDVPISHDQGRDIRRCPGPGYCSSWHKDCFCPTVVSQGKQVTANTYLEQMAFSVKCNKTHINPTLYLNDVCY